MADDNNQYKIVLVGDSHVGKTALFKQLGTHQFDPTTSPTIGSACTAIDLPAPDGVGTYHAVLWDTAGQDTYREIVPMYFHRADFILIVYDITSEMSFRSVNEWVTLSREHSTPTTTLFLIGNKKDLESERAVSGSDGADIVHSLELDTFVEVSAKDGSMIEDLTAMLGDFISRKIDLSDKPDDFAKIKTRSVPGKCPC